MDSDTVERELERLVFGDEANFQNGVSNFTQSSKWKPSDIYAASIDNDDGVDHANVLENLEDEDV
jgi:hypothetical protein